MARHRRKKRFAASNNTTMNTGIGDLYQKALGVFSDTKRKDRMVDMMREDAFYFNGQWDADEAEDLEVTGQTDIVLNAMRRALRSTLGNIVSTPPSADFLPTDMLPNTEARMQKFQQLRNTLTELKGLFNHSLYISDGPILIERAIRDMLVMGVHYINCFIDPAADYYRGEVKFRNRRAWNMGIPLNSKAFGFTDAKYMFYRSIISVEEALELTEGKYKNLILNSSFIDGSLENLDVAMYGPDSKVVYNKEFTAATDSIRNYKDEDKLVEYFEYETKVNEPAKLYKIIHKNGYLETLVFSPKDTKDLDRFDIKQFLHDTLIEYQSTVETEIYVPRIKQVRFIGDSVKLDEEILPTEHYTNVPLINEDTWNPLSLGEAFFVAPVQRLLNKVFSLAVVHLQTSGSGDKLLGLKGAFGKTPAQIAAFQQNYMRSSSVTELEFEHDEGNGVTIDRLLKNIQATPLQPAVVQVLQMLTVWIDRLIGSDPLSYGDSSNAPRTLGATMGLKQWSDQNSMIPMKHIDWGLTQLGKIWFDMATNHYDYPKSVSLPDPNSQLPLSYMFNAPDGDGNIIHSLQGVRANITVVSGSVMMNNKFTMLQMFQQLMPMHPIFMKLWVTYSDLPNKFGILEQIDQYDQMQGELQKLMGSLQQMQQEIESKDEQLMAEKEKVQLARLRANINNIETKYREWTKYSQKEQQLLNKLGGKDAN